MTLLLDSSTTSPSPGASASELLRRTVLDNPFIPKFHPGFPSIPQATYLTLPCEEMLYGGATGGGKSAGILAAATQFVDVPGYDALILRRTFADLNKPGALIPMSKEWFTGKAFFSEQLHRWLFPSGATISFGYLDNDNDKYQYQGAQFAFIGFDELTQFTEPMYTYLFSRLRRLSGSGVPARMRSTSNPGGIGHSWVRKRFIVPWQKRIETTTRFVPAKLRDNPGIDIQQYRRALSRLSPVERQQLEDGDWDVLESGGVFSVAALSILRAGLKPGKVGIIQRKSA